MNRLKKSARKILRFMGFDIVRYGPKTHPLARRKMLLDTYKINVVLDVGANIGQYGEQLREIGYTGTILSFEPLSSAFEKLTDRSRKDPSWSAFNFALGAKEETTVINIAGNSYSSSILEILPAHVKSAPASEYIGKEEITVKKLDSIYPSVVKPGDEVYLKIDTQGFEEHVLKGASVSLNSISTIQLEMSLTPLYQEGLLFDEVCQMLYEREYMLVALEPGFTDEETGQLLQVDGIFHRM